jgi:hypothetical protein
VKVKRNLPAVLIIESYRRQISKNAVSVIRFFAKLIAAFVSLRGTV